MLRLRHVVCCKTRRKDPNIGAVSISKYQETRLLQRSSICFTCKQGLANFPRYETVEQARYGEFDEAAIDSNCLFRHFFSRTVPMQSIVSFLIADALYCNIVHYTSTYLTSFAFAQCSNLLFPLP